MSDRDRKDYDGFENYDNYDTRFDYKYPTSSKTSPNKRNDYDGVEYIPSGRAPSRRSSDGSGTRRTDSGSRTYSGSQITRGEGGQRSSAAGNQPVKRRVKNQSQSAIFMAIIVGAGVLLCAGAFFLMFNLMKPNPVKTDPPSGSSAAVTDKGGDVSTEEPEVVLSDSEITGSVKSISNGTITVVAFENESINDIFVNQDTQLRNRYGQAMTLAQFGEGDIVIAEYDSLTRRAQVLRLDPEAWTRTSVKNIEISPEITTVKAGNDTLSISPEVIFLPAGTAGAVKPSDVVTLKGRKSKIMTVIVEKRSGTIEFTNKDKITDGTVEINADIYKALEETGSLRVSTGEHTVVVKGSNIDAFIKEVTVGEGKTVVIDLAEAQIKEGIVNLTVNEADYTLFVNDEEIARSGQPLKLPFGTYKLKITKEGFTPWEGNVTVNQPSVSVEAAITAEVKMGRVSVFIVSPAGLAASIYIDNALIGTTPINRASVTYGTHQLTVSAPGYVDTSMPIIVEGDVTYNVTLHPTPENVNNVNNANVNTNAGADTNTNTNTNADANPGTNVNTNPDNLNNSAEVNIENPDYDPTR